MAIKVSGTTVIDNNLAVIDVTDVKGEYTSLHPVAMTIGTVIDMSSPLMVSVLTANRTFSVSNLSTGHIAILLLDVGADGNTPTFPSSIKWPGDTTPSFSGTREWLIGLTCWDDSTIRATATGWGSQGVATPTADLTMAVNPNQPAGSVVLALWGYSAGNWSYPGTTPNSPATTPPYATLGTIDNTAVPTDMYSSPAGTIEAIIFRDGTYYISQSEDIAYFEISSASAYYPNQSRQGGVLGTGWSVIVHDAGNVSNGGAKSFSRSSGTYSTFIRDGDYVTRWIWNTGLFTGSANNDSSKNGWVGAPGAVDVTIT